MPTFVRTADSLIYPIDDKAPANKPIAMAPKGLVIKLQALPITTPPANVEFRISSIPNFYLKRAEVVNAAITLPVNDRNVLTIANCL